MPRRLRSALSLLLVAGTLLTLAAHPEVLWPPLREHPPRPPPLPQDLAGLEQAVEAWNAAAPAERRRYGQWLRVALEAERRALQGAIRAHEAARTAQLASTFDGLFGLLRAAALGFLLLPLLAWRRARGRRPRFLVYCLLSAAVLFVTLSLFQLLISSSVNASAAVVSGANPQQAMLDAAFDRVDHRLDAWIRPPAEGGVPLGPTLGSMRQGSSADFVTHLVENLEYLDVAALRPIAEGSRFVYRVLGLAPIVVPILVTLVFLLTSGSVFRQLLLLPFRALRGEPRAGRRVLALLGRTLWHELLAVLLFVLSLALPALILHVAVRYLAYAVFEGMTAQSVELVAYMGRLTRPPQEAWLTAGLLAIPALLLLALGAALGATLAFTLWSRRLAQLRFHRHVPLRAHGFWRPALGRLFRIQAALALLLWYGIAWGGRLAPAGGGGDSATALAGILWRAGTPLVLVLAGALLFRVPQDLLWFVRFGPVRGARREAPGERSGSPAGP